MYQKLLPQRHIAKMIEQRTFSDRIYCTKEPLYEIFSFWTKFLKNFEKVSTYLLLEKKTLYHFLAEKLPFFKNIACQLKFWDLRAAPTWADPGLFFSFIPVKYRMY